MHLINHAIIQASQTRLCIPDGYGVLTALNITVIELSEVTISVSITRLIGDTDDES
jgi:hypothetical protein